MLQRAMLSLLYEILLVQATLRAEQHELHSTLHAWQRAQQGTHLTAGASLLSDACIAGQNSAAASAVV